MRVSSDQWTLVWHSSNNSGAGADYCHATQAHAPSRVRETASYLLQSLASTEDERRLATEAMEWLSSEQDEPKPAAVKPKRKM